MWELLVRIVIFGKIVFCLEEMSPLWWHLGFRSLTNLLTVCRVGVRSADMVCLLSRHRCTPSFTVAKLMPRALTHRASPSPTMGRRWPHEEVRLLEPHPGSAAVVRRGFNHSELCQGRRQQWAHWADPHGLTPPLSSYAFAPCSAPCCRWLGQSPLVLNGGGGGHPWHRSLEEVQ